jgi:hypothetical protein
MSTLQKAFKSIRCQGDRFTIRIAGVVMSARTKQDAKRRAYKHVRIIRLRRQAS